MERIIGKIDEEQEVSPYKALTEEEFNDEFQKIYGTLYSAAVNITKNTTLSKDLVQETFAIAASNREKYRKGTYFKAWCIRIMKNMFINQYRSKKRRTNIVNTLELGTYEESLHKNYEENLVEEGFSLETIKHEIDSLEKKLKEPFHLNYQGYSYQEISEILSMPIGTIKSRIFMARVALIKNLSNIDDGLFLDGRTKRRGK